MFTQKWIFYSFPSYLNAPGRPIMEAGFFKVPSISCIDNPINDTFIDGKTGFSITLEIIRVWLIK